MSRTAPPISFVIPTLWRPDTVIALLTSLEQSTHVLEVIVIDNAPKKRPQLPHLAKLRLVEQEQNCFVNPAWNAGVKMAQSTLVCLCNDDVLLAGNLLHFIRRNPIKGIVGLHPDSYSRPLEMPPTPRWSNELFIKKNWGSVLFFEKDRYVPVPETMKIWWGDAWLAQEMRPARSIQTAVWTQHSVSAGAVEFIPITEEDTRIWNGEYKKSPSFSQRFRTRLRSFRRKL